MTKASLKQPKSVFALTPTTIKMILAVVGFGLLMGSLFYLTKNRSLPGVKDQRLAKYLKVLKSKGSPPDEISESLIILGQSGEDQAHGLALEYADSADLQIKRAAADALGQFGTSAALEKLGKLIGDLDSGVRERAILAIAFKKTPQRYEWARNFYKSHKFDLAIDKENFLLSLGRLSSLQEDQKTWVTELLRLETFSGAKKAVFILPLWDPVCKTLKKLYEKSVLIKEDYLFLENLSPTACYDWSARFVLQALESDDPEVVASGLRSLSRYKTIKWDAQSLAQKWKEQPVILSLIKALNP